MMKRFEMGVPRIQTLQPEARKNLTRVLFFSRSAVFSGAEESLCKTIAAMKGVTATVIVPFDGWYAAQLRKSGAVVLCANQPLFDWDWRVLHLIRETIRNIQPHIIHLNSLLPSHQMAILKAERIPILQHVRISNLDGFGASLRQANLIVTVSDFVASNVRITAGVPVNIQTIHNGIDVDAFKPATSDQRFAARSSLGIPKGASVISMVGRFEEWKRHDFLACVVRDLRANGKNVFLLMLGHTSENNPIYGNIQQFAREPHVKGFIAVLGFQGNMQKFYAATDVFALPSVGEPFARSILEAMACGLPVVGCRSGGNVEQIVSGKTGILVSLEDRVGFRQAIEISLDESESKRLGTQAREWVVKQPLRHNDCARAVESLYQSMQR